MPEFSERARFSDEFVLVDGITRAGKFVMAHVVAGFVGMEFFQYSCLLENALYLLRLHKIDLATCRALLEVDLDISSFNMMVGRYLNTRVSDMSCIYNACDPAEFVDRAGVLDRDALVEKFQRERRLPLFISHEGLANVRALFGIFPRVKMINLIRDPVMLILSWYKRGWGRRIGNDPRSSWITFKGPSGPFPWWATGWEKDYNQFSEMDRCVKSIATLSDMARDDFNAADDAVKARIRMVRFETLVTAPEVVISQVGDFLERQPAPGLQTILTRERLPRVVSGRDRETALRAIQDQVSVDLTPVLDRLIHEYEHYWCTLCV
jgi:hypothetical protein